ncbi:acriflavin resistance protein [Spirochaetia bacterium]|nr:acriflavin resistance protein [Spirochaetia bacterium]
MKHIIAFSVKHPVSVLSGLIAVILLGLLCSFLIPVDFLPALSSRNLLVAAEYPGISAADMRSMVTIPLEDAFASLRGLKSASSVSRDGLSLLSLELHWGQDIDMALTESRELIDLCYETLPSGCAKPTVLRNDAARKDTLTIALIPLDGDLRYGRHIAETDIKSRFQRLSGIAQVTVSGGEKEEIQVRFRRSELESRRLTLQSAADIISSSNFEYPAGTIREGERELSVKTSGLYTSLEEIKNTPLAYNEGGLLRVADIADTVRTGAEGESFFLYNGLECIRIGIQKKVEASPLGVTRLAKEEIEMLKNIYGAWYEFEIISNTADSIVESLVSLIFSALAALLAAGIVVYVFLKSIRFSIIIALIIPISAAFSILALSVCGETLNTMSLSGIAIGIGMVIDSGTVVIENIQRALSSAGDDHNDNPRPSGKALPEKPVPAEIITNAANGVALSNFGSALSTVIVFIPVFFIGGLLGELFSGMAIAIIASISASCVLSFTYVPALCMITREGKEKRKGTGAFIGLAEKKYASLLEKIFVRKRYVFIPLGVCLIAGFISLAFIRYQLLPEIRTKNIRWEISFPPDTGLPAMLRQAQEITASLQQEPYINSIEIAGGLEHDDCPTLAQPGEYGEKLRITASLKIPADEGVERIRALFEGSPFSPVFNKQQDTLSQLLEIAADTGILRADSPERLAMLTEDLAEKGAEIIPRLTRSESVFTPDRLAGARFSVSAQYMAAAARDALEGVFAVSYYEKGREIPLRVLFRSEDIASIEDLKNTLVPLAEDQVPLRILGSISGETREQVLYRYNRRDAKEIRLPVSENKKSADLTKANLILVNEMEGCDLVSPGAVELKEMIHSGLLLIMVTILLLYLTMGAQFESFVIPLLLLISIPPAFSGAFLFLLISNNSLDINSIIALIILFGISINNSILLYESCIGQKTMGGEINRTSIIDSCRNKLQAILITNTTTIIALIPFAIDPLHINAQASLSIAVIGGLLFSTILVLTVVPVCFRYVLPGRKRHA